MPEQHLEPKKTENTSNILPSMEAACAQRGALASLSLQQKFLRAATMLTTVYLCALFLGLPLVFGDFYFNITETKQYYFLCTSGVYLLLLLFARIALPPDYGVRRARVDIHPAVIALFSFFAVSLVGSFISRYPGEAFYGENNRYQGLLTLFCYACLVFALSRREIDLRWPERAYLLAAGIVSLLGLLHHFGADPIGFYEDLSASDQGRFLSTIGNANFFGSYMVLSFSVAIGYCLRASTRKSRAFAVLSLALVSFGSLIAGSDSVVLGLLAVAALAPLLLFSDAAALRRLPLGWVVFFLCAFVFGQIAALLPSATYLSSFVTKLSRPSVSLPLAAAAFALWLALRRTKPERLSRAIRPYAITLLSALLAGALILVLLNTVLRELPLGSFARYLRFSESWGTDRGKIWTFVLRLYAKLPVAQQFFGASSGALFHADAVSPLFPDAALDTAHNEYLQYLVTNGALGLMSYLAALAFTIRAGVRRSKYEPIYRGLTLAVMAYAAQAAVNIAQPMTTPIFFVLLGILISRKPENAPPISVETA
jgi:hypothetical protein